MALLIKRKVLFIKPVDLREQSIAAKPLIKLGVNPFTSSNQFTDSFFAPINKHK